MKNPQTVKNQWKPVDLDTSVINGNLEGLIGIEECTDYNLSDIIPSDKKNKRKHTEHDTPGKYVRLTSKKLSKKKRKSKKNIENTLSTSGTTSNDCDQIDDIENDAEEPEHYLEEMHLWDSYGLSHSLLKGLKELGFTQPTQIQALTLPPAILGKRDILGAAETGSGKTLAFGLPMLMGILNLKNSEKEIQPEEENGEDDLSENEVDEENMELSEEGIGFVKSIDNIQMETHNKLKPLYALILTPTRELAMQVKSHLSAVAKFAGIKVAVVVGGMAAVKQERILNQCPEVVVATPGRLWELIQSGNPHLSQIDNIKFLAIDETDRMLEKGHFQELHHILEKLNIDESKCKARQNFVFSATLTLVHELPKYLRSKKRITNSRRLGDLTPEQKLQKIVDTLGITAPKIVDVTSGTGTSSTLTECRITCTLEEKDYYVYYFLQKHPGRTLIFCNSIGCVKRLSTILNLLECQVLPLHASMQQRQRLKNLDKFKENDHAILIATDVAARGLDIPCIEHVLHYQTPRTSESYVHRSGRTARASKDGITVLLIEPSELQSYLRLCRTLGKTEDIPAFPVQAKILNAVKERVNMARDLDKLELQVRKANSESGWLEKAAEDMDIIIDDRVFKHDKSEARQIKKSADIKRKQLSMLLSKPLLPKGFSGKYIPTSEDAQNLTLLANGGQQEKAIDVMKSALESYGKEKKKFKPLYKGKKIQKGGDKERTLNNRIKLNKNKKGQINKKR